MTTAWDSAMTATSFRWFILRVEPERDQVDDQVRHAEVWGDLRRSGDRGRSRPSCPILAKYFLVRFGKEVATTEPSLTSSTLSMPEHSGAATDSRQWPKFRS